ncbi:uncharacterized protein LOC142353259 [Convolutriloba macropyga]|uniref:uncharacterized protein LOC142353259 n=1 Tax=Convolutriloba macropyga TaxID=536237 RepID=UPI003F526681
MYTCQYVSNEQLVSELQQLWLDINGEAVTADKVRTELQTVCRSNQDNLEGQIPDVGQDDYTNMKHPKDSDRKLKIGVIPTNGTGEPDHSDGPDHGTIGFPAFHALHSGIHGDAQQNVSQPRVKEKPKKGIERKGSSVTAPPLLESSGTLTMKTTTVDTNQTGE